MDLTHEGIYYYTSETHRYLMTELPKIKRLISSNHTITIIIAIAITLFCIIVFIRQRKILRKLDELTKKTEEPTSEDKP